MTFQWLQMRITEENDRRLKESQTLERLPRVMDEVHGAIVDCVNAYASAFGTEAIELKYFLHKLRLTVNEQKEGKWEKAAKVEVNAVTKPPGIRVDCNGNAFEIEVGLLPGDKLFYKDGEKFLTMEELTRRILDRALFPKLGE
jgi:hypothetical protein